MKVLVIGGTGTIGAAVVKELSKRHEVLAVGQSSGDWRCDIASQDSIRALYEKTGPFDAVVACTGNVHFDPLANMTAEKYAIGLNHKLMGQVNLVLLGIQYMNDRGSFTLTSGVLADDPIVAGSSASMVNGALHSFVKAAAIELPRGIRLNVVSPGLLTESQEKFEAFFRGYEPVPAARVALAYSKSVEGAQTGQVYKVG